MGKTCIPATGSNMQLLFKQTFLLYGSVALPPWCLWLGHPGLPTLPWATSSLWAAEADLTRALVAAAMDLAASKICSSKSRVSSACYNGKKTKSNAMCSHRGLFLPNYLLLDHLALRVSIAFLLTSHTQGREASPSAASPPFPLESKSC